MNIENSGNSVQPHKKILTNRVATHLENLEKSGNSKVVREKSGKMEKVREFHVVWKVATLNKQNSFSLIKYLCNTTRSWTSNEQSLMNFGDGRSALVICYIAGVDVE